MNQKKHWKRCLHYWRAFSHTTLSTTLHQDLQLQWRINVTSLTRVSPIIRMMLSFFHGLSIYSNKYGDGCTKVATAKLRMIELSKIGLCKGYLRLCIFIYVLFESNITNKYNLCVKYFEDLCNISERWARCFWNDELIRGSNTNNYVEVRFLVIKDSLLKRQILFPADHFKINNKNDNPKSFI